MPEVNPISNNSSVSTPAASQPAVPRPAKAPEPPPPPKAPEPADPKFELKRYTARYQMDGDRLNIQILDADGRLVRTVPPNELLKALQGEFRRARLNWQG